MTKKIITYFFTLIFIGLILLVASADIILNGKSNEILKISQILFFLIVIIRPLFLYYHKKITNLLN